MIILTTVSSKKEAIFIAKKLLDKTSKRKTISTYHKNK